MISRSVAAEPFDSQASQEIRVSFQVGSSLRLKNRGHYTRASRHKKSDSRFGAVAAFYCLESGLVRPEAGAQVAFLNERRRRWTRPSRSQLRVVHVSASFEWARNKAYATRE